MDSIEYMEREKKMAEYDGLDKVWKSNEADEYFKNLKKPEIFNSGIGKLNRILGGFKPGEVVVISGKSGDGKTTLARSLTYDFTLCSHEKHSLWFSYELPPREFLRKFKEHGMPYFYMPIHLMSADMQWFEDKIIETRCKYNQLDIVFLDHLHYIVPPTKYQNMSIIIGEAMRSFVRIAHDYNIVLFLIAHIKNIDPKELAHKEHIRDSSFCVQESDAVIMIRRILPHHTEYNPDMPNCACLSVEKNRREGILQDVDVQLKNGRFYEEISERSV